MTKSKTFEEVLKVLQDCNTRFFQNPTLGHHETFQKCLESLHRQLVNQYVQTTFAISWIDLNYSRNPHRIAIQNALKIVQDELQDWLLKHGDYQDQIKKINFIGFFNGVRYWHIRFCYVTHDGKHHDIFTDIDLHHTDDAEQDQVARLKNSLSEDTLDRIAYMKSRLALF